MIMVCFKQAYPLKTTETEATYAERCERLLHPFKLFHSLRPQIPLCILFCQKHMTTVLQRVQTLRKSTLVYNFTPALKVTWMFTEHWCPVAVEIQNGFVSSHNVYDPSVVNLSVHHSRWTSLQTCKPSCSFYSTHYLVQYLNKKVQLLVHRLPYFMRRKVRLLVCGLILLLLNPVLIPNERHCMPPMGVA